MRFIFFLLMLTSLSACAVQNVNLKVTVSDGDDNPVDGALVKGFFFQDQVVDKQHKPGHQDITDSDGVAELSGREEIHVDLKVTKAGYYTSKKKIIVRNNNYQDVSIVLREIKKPIAMYAKTLVLNLPERRKRYGLDFFKGDLVLPGRNGVREDVSIMVSGELSGYKEFTQSMVMSFPNENDGITKAVVDSDWKFSDFKSNYEAPLDGYMNNIIITNSRDKSGYIATNVNVPFYLKIRSTNQTNSAEVSSHYCKIWPGIELYGVRAKTPSLKMTYFCNSTINDRNVEFDPSKNKYRKLSVSEQVTTP